MCAVRSMALVLLFEPSIGSFENQVTKLFSISSSCLRVVRRFFFISGIGHHFCKVDIKQTLVQLHYAFR